MSGVPYTFGNATTTIALSNLDTNFATPVTIGTTTVGLGNTTTTLAGLSNVSTTVTNTSNVASNGSLLLQTNGTTTAVTIDTSQNVGIGNSPASWYTGSGYKVLQINSSSIFADTSEYRLQFMANMYTNSSGSLTYTSSGYANFMQMRQGGFNFFTNSTSGTAGNAVTTYTQAMTLQNNGQFCLGTTSQRGSCSLTLSTDSGTTQWAVGPYTANSGQFYVAATTSTGVYLNGTSAVGWSSNSDERLKTDLVPIANAVTKVNSLRSVTGRYNTDPTGTSRAFLIAQDVQAVLPEAVGTFQIPESEDKTEYLSLSYTEMIPLLVASIKELSAQVTTLQSQVAALQAKVGA